MNFYGVFVPVERKKNEDIECLYHRSEFASKEDDVSRAFEDFFCASKGTLTPSEIAKIRDELGVIGMAGI